MVVSRRSGLTDHRAVSASAGASCARGTRPLVEQPTIAARADHRPRSVLPIDPSRHGAGVCARSEGARSGARGHRDRSLRGPRDAVGEDFLLLAFGALRGAHASGGGGQARRGTGGTGAGRATQDPGALGGASPRPSRRHRALRAPSSSQRSPGAAIHAVRSSTTWPAASSSICVRCRADLARLPAVAGYSAAAA